MQLTAEKIALAIVAAATVYRDDPSSVLGAKSRNGGRALTAAAAALSEASGKRVSDVCRLLNLPSQRLYAAVNANTGSFQRARRAAVEALGLGGRSPAQAPVASAPIAEVVAAPAPPKAAAAIVRADCHWPSAFQAAGFSPLTDNQRRFCRWFLRAGWPADQVAELFNVDEAAVAALGDA